MKTLTIEEQREVREALTDLRRDHSLTSLDVFVNKIKEIMNYKETK